MEKLLMKDGVILNRGDWDTQPIQDIVGYENPWLGPLAQPDDWDPKPIYGEVITNPFPEGAVYEEHEIAYTDKGRLVLASDYLALRQDAYPSQEEQLLAYFKGGAARAAMEAKIAEVDAKYPAN